MHITGKEKLNELAQGHPNTKSATKAQPATPAQADIRKGILFIQPPLPNRKEH